MDIDVLIFGGGVAGLWLLDELQRAGYAAALVEVHALGAGQTIVSQGIIHGGIKYTLTGLFSESARAIRDMPDVWRACLRGTRQPDLSDVTVLSDVCYLWRTQSLPSRAGLLGAASGLRSPVEKLPGPKRPAVLERCPGDVFAVHEQVIDVAGLLRAFAQRLGSRMLKIEAGGVEFELEGPGRVRRVRLRRPGAAELLDVRAESVVLTAGAGNAALCGLAGLSPDVMQRRPLHQVMVRGDLPMLFGHCVDGAHTRATITSIRDSQDRTVWNIGGQIAEDGVKMDGAELIAHARRELRTALPGLALEGTQWASYRVDRAEPSTPGGARPAGACAMREGNVITAWPTKLALAPELARMILGLTAAGRAEGDVPADWPRPAVALPPWQTCDTWVSPSSMD